MSSPTVSVIVPNFNHARFLRKRLDSILAQTYEDFELILLDDCSTDDSRTILREYAPHPRVTHVEFNETNSGSPFKQWNRGVRLAQGKYVWIAESDDYADLRFIERLTTALDGNPEAVLAYCRSWRVNDDDCVAGNGDYYLHHLDAQQWSSDFCMAGSEICRRYFARINPIPNASSVLFRKSIYERVGGADEDLRLCGDWKLWAGMAFTGSVLYVCEPLNYFRCHNLSVRSTLERMGANVPEDLALCRWVLDQLAISETYLEEICAVKAGFWIVPLVSRRTPIALKRNIVRRARALDPHPIRRAARFLPSWITARIWQKLSRNLWYPMLNLTYDIRHAVGLTREGFAQLKARFGR
jgi:cellulose synthase/poly-beta-1,6-N-acetylglucosamine synthase-like glycosyltransferase